MKKLISAAVIGSFVIGVAPAVAGDGEAWCEAFTEASGISDEPCACVVETVETDPALAEELYAFANRDEFVANGSSELKALIEPCTGEAS